MIATFFSHFRRVRIYTVLGFAALLAAPLCRAQSYTITTVAGGGSSAGKDGLGDGGPAVMAPLAGNDGGLCVDSSGNLYIADTGDNVIRKVTPAGVISVVAGDINGGGYYGDGGPAVGAGLNQPQGVAVDSAGNLYIADFLNLRIRKVSTSGTITTVAGGGMSFALSGPATQAYLSSPVALAVDSTGNLFIASNLGGGASAQIHKVSPDGTMTAFAGTNDPPFTHLGDGGPATDAYITISELAVDASGNVYIADAGQGRIRRVSTSGIITTVAGSASMNYSGDGGPATSAGLNRPSGVAVDATGNIYVADTGDYRIRKVTPDGTITSIAGTGKPGNSGDNGPAASATINTANTIAAGLGGAIYFTDVRASDGDGLVRLLSPVLAAPAISPGAVVPLFSASPTIQPGEWVSIFGSNLASGATSWNGDFPTSLNGTSVTINNRPAYLSYVSPGQINLQAPDDTAAGSVSVVVKTSGGTATSTVTLGQFGPSFCLLDGKHVAGIILRSDGSGAYGGGTYDIVGPTGTSLGYKTVAARAGDVIELFGVGFGPTNPTVLAGKAYSGAAPTTNPVQLSINNVAVPPAFAGITSAGLYQLNVGPLPAGLGTGDVKLQATVGGVQTPSAVVISLQ